MLAAYCSRFCDRRRVCASNCSWSVLERCWIDAGFGVLLQPVSSELEIVYPWLFVFQWFVVLFLGIIGIVTVRFAGHAGISSLWLHC